MPTPRAMAPQDLTRIRFASDPQISPDGRTVAFVVTVLSEDKDEYLSNIWVASTAGGEPRRFTTGPRRDTAPRWSPDGSRLAFISEREPGKKGQLHVMPAAGRRGDPSHRSPARPERARVVARRHAPRLRRARGRRAGARVRGGQAQVEAARA